MAKATTGKAPSPRGIARRERLIEVTIRFLARNGSRGTSLAEIAAEAGVSQAGLLYHYPTKEDLLHAALDRRDEVEDWVLRDPHDPGLGIVNILADQVARWATHPDMVGMHTVLVAENVSSDSALHPRLIDRYGRTISRIADILSRAQERGEVRADANVHQKAIELISFINGLETAWLLDPTIPAAETAAAWASDQMLALAPK